MARAWAFKPSSCASLAEVPKPHGASPVVENVKMSGHWVGDAHGAKEFHATIVSLSARFSPAQRGPEGEVHHGPELSAQLRLRHQLSEGQRDDLLLDEATFEGDSFHHIRAQFDAWAQERMARIVNALATEFDLRRPRS